MSNFTVIAITRIPYEADEEPGMPTFRLEGTWKGAPSVYNVSVELDGRDADWDHQSGADPSADAYADDAPDEAEGEWLDAEEALYEALYDSEAFKQADEEYNG